MAMPTCIDCGKDVSDSAEKCPNCGATYPSSRDGDTLKTFGIAAVVIFVFWAIASNLDL